MSKHYRNENDCLNCGTALAGKYCHHCGQENLEVKETFGHMMNHAISDYFHFDHQFFHTLKPLFSKPGFLTNQYIAGRRVQYLHPVKMYIFISLIYFLMVFQESKNVVTVDKNQQTTGYVKSAAQKEFENDLNKDNDLTPEQKQQVLQQISRNSDGLAKPHPLTAASRKVNVLVKNSKPKIRSGLVSITVEDTSYAQYLASQNKLPPAKRDGRIGRYISRKALSLNDPKVNKKELIGEGLKHNAPKMMFLVLPLFALILGVAFRKNKKFYVEHLIFSFHLHCFIFLFITVVMILKFLIPAGWETVKDTLDFFVSVIIIWYIYRALRVVYQRSRWRTISKMTGIAIIYSIVGLICFMLLTIITALTVL